MWHLDGERATITNDELSATITLSRPGVGMTQLKLAEKRMGTDSLFRVLGGGFGATGEEHVSESYLRGEDLFAAYPSNASRDVRYEMYWRALPRGIELIVSARTDKLDSNPQLQISSLLTSDELLHLADESQRRWAVIAPSGMEIETGCGVTLRRLAGCDWSCVEMVHSADFCGATVGPTSAGQSSTAFQLFDRQLEKGVILRARLQAVFVDRADDQQTALQLYRRFSEAPLPLAT